jgi:hypothetical protein
MNEQHNFHDGSIDGLISSFGIRISAREVGHEFLIE